MADPRLVTPSVDIEVGGAIETTVPAGDQVRVPAGGVHPQSGWRHPRVKGSRHAWGATRSWMASGPHDPGE